MNKLHNEMLYKYESIRVEQRLKQLVDALVLPLGEVTSGPRSESPIIDVELLSDEETRNNSDNVGTYGPLKRTGVASNNMQNK